MMYRNSHKTLRPADFLIHSWGSAPFHSTEFGVESVRESSANEIVETIQIGREIVPQVHAQDAAMTFGKNLKISAGLRSLDDAE